jgi:hypothetical protein
VIQFLFNLLRIKGLYMFQALLSHPQETCTSGTWCIASVGCYQGWSGKEFYANTGSSRCVGLKILPPSCADCLEIWEPQPPGTLRACLGL